MREETPPLVKSRPRSGLAMARLFQYQRLKYLILLALTSVLLLQPLRLVFLSLLMPQTWVDTDTTHLYHVMNDFQNFEVDSKPLAKDAAYHRVQVGSDYRYCHGLKKEFYLQQSAGLVHLLPEYINATYTRVQVLSYCHFLIEGILPIA